MHRGTLAQQTDRFCDAASRGCGGCGTSKDRYRQIDCCIYMYIRRYTYINFHLRSKRPDFVMPPAEAVAAVVRM